MWLKRNSCFNVNNIYKLYTTKRLCSTKITVRFFIYIYFINIHIIMCSALFQEQKVKVGDKEIFYVKSGNGNNAILLMPGLLGSSWTDFKPQIEQLPALIPNSTIIAWDPPGISYLYKINHKETKGILI